MLLAESESSFTDWHVFIDKVKETIDRVKRQYAYNADIHTCFSKDIDSIFLEVLLMKNMGPLYFIFIL